MNSIKTKLFCLITWVMAMTAAHLTAQTFTVLHNFAADSNYGPNSGGAGPLGGLISSGNTLYGTTEFGGPSSEGTVFAVNADGTDFTSPFSFDGDSDENAAYPFDGLILSGNTFYGTQGGAGTTSGGVFAVNTNGTGFTNVYNFTPALAPSYTNSDGAFPYGEVLLLGNTLYGTTPEGGTSGNGTVFAVNTDGTGFTNLHSFTATNSDGVNSDGAYAYEGLVSSGNTLYGTAYLGGGGGTGTVFAVNTDGTGFTTLYSFAAAIGTEGGDGTNSDGANPLGRLILSGDTLYGTAHSGGSSGAGTVFALNTNGTGFTTLHSFAAGSGTYPHFTNSEGGYPYAGLILLGSTLYGAAQSGGSGGSGTVLALNTKGTGFTTLHSFAGLSGSEGNGGYGANSGGAYPDSVLIISGNTLFGTADYGGSLGNGTLFSVSLPTPPPLTITASGTNVILTWPPGVNGYSTAGYALQSATNLASPAAWTSVVPTPVVVNGQLTVTNPVSGTQQFYRLSQ